MDENMDNNTRQALVMAIRTIFDDDSSSSDTSSDSTSSDEVVSDDEVDLDVLRAIVLVGETRGEVVPLPRVRNYVENFVHLQSPSVFKSHFRLFPASFELVLRLIGPGLTNTPSASGRKPIPAEKQLLIALSYMGTPDSYRSVCEKFGVGKATALRSLRRVAFALYCLAPRYIKWPRENRVAEVMREFGETSHFPRVIGAVDGCQIPIDGPKEDKRSYINRKGRYSVHLQGVCDAKCVFTHCTVGNVGSVHDSRVFKNSELATFLANPDEYFPDDSHLIGDAGYAIHPHLMTPFRDNGNLTEAQKNYNYRLSQSRVHIERAFGFLKGRFRSLRDNLSMTDMTKIPEFIMACCVLHNFCILEGDHLEEEEIVLANNVQLNGAAVNFNDEGMKAEANLKMTVIMNNLPPRPPRPVVPNV